MADSTYASASPVNNTMILAAVKHRIHLLPSRDVVEAEVICGAQSARLCGSLTSAEFTSEHPAFRYVSALGF